ncbi:CBS domain [Rubrobacter radiotolerans]|uniref:CBS and ACT domain-containing protein n=1 Tax=Rubrobacter radiotolerans TaxID=42256 RepID=A0A023X2A2_RUBRA|nr:CBS and ACT domain-containing protein [Rubrobacter radiotolerans]AHY46120.1 CBS domain [Rubrobacter radiotolerans]MDX5893530.1 CBS and ACT domain-containing protein [Rubrobacter radiotolerans]SMC03929.1 acetoin utilization protein AcuB [Rubrobacter radiotolerans DSM 5868]
MLKVRDSMTRDVVTLGPEASVAQAWEIVRGRGVRHIPIVEDGRLVGLVSDRDLRDASPIRKSSDGGEDENVFGWSSMRDIMTRKPVTISPFDTIEHAAREIYERRIGCLPVVDGGELVGIITSADMMRTLIELFGAGKPGTWVEVEVADEPGALAGIVDTVSERHVNLASVFVAPGHRVSDKVIALRLETTNPKGIVGALGEAGYSVEVVESSESVETTHREK